MSCDEKNPEVAGQAAAAPDAAAASETGAAPRGRPFARGRSGNPQGRPSRAHQAAWVGRYKIDRQTIPLVDDLVLRAHGDKALLRSCIERIVPPRREAPVWLAVAPIETAADAKAALKAVATAVSQGDIPPAQGLKLVRIYTEVFRYL